MNMMPSNATSLQSEEQSDDRQQIPMNSLPESQGKGMDGYQRYHHIVLIVTVEQEKAIVGLFKQKNWMYIKAGQWQTHADMQGMCDRMSDVSRELYTSDQALNSHIEPKSLQETSKHRLSVEDTNKHRLLGKDTNKHGLPGDLSDLPDIDLLSETTVTSLMKADNSIIKVKEDRDIEHDESSITYDIREDVDKETGTASESEETDTASESDGLCSTSQILPNITDVNASQVESNIMKGSDYPTFMSDLAKPIMGEQNTFHPPHSARQTKPKSESATAGIVKGGAIQLGIRCEVCETCFQNQKYFEDHVINGQCKWVCKLCTKAFVYSNYKAGNRSYFYSLFKEKLDKHKKECDCTCKLCGFSCQEPKRLARHMKCRHSQQYACDVCLMTFKSEMNLYTHKIGKHTSKTGMYCCPLCPKEYQMLASVSAHLRFSHLGHKKREMPCSVCGKIFDYTTIKHHEDRHKIKNIKCDKCPATFNHNGALRQHKRRHNKDYSYYCESCGKGFYTTTELRHHRRIHTGEKPFSCSLCQYSCNVKANLDKHMTIIHGKPLNQRP